MSGVRTLDLYENGKVSTYLTLTPFNLFIEF